MSSIPVLPASTMPAMNVIIVIANGWNTGWLGCYGNEWLQTPCLDQFAAESVLFDEHYAVNPSPAEWARALVSGRFEGDIASGFGARVVHVQDGRQPIALFRSAQHVPVIRDDEQSPGAPLLKAVKKQLPTDGPFLMIVETDRLLPTWSVSLDFFDKYIDSVSRDEGDESPQPWDEPPQGQVELSNRDIERLQATYAAVVSEWDADFGKLMKLLGPRLDDTAVIVTSGHGQSLGERGWIGPVCGAIHEETGHVPLMIRLPGAKNAQRHVRALTSSVDLLPTIHDLLGVPPLPSLHGRSLRPLTERLLPPALPYVIQSLADGRQSLQTGQCTLVTAPGTPARLYDKPGDRWEMHDCRMLHLEWAEHLESLLPVWKAAIKAEPFVPPELGQLEEEVEDEHREAGG